jgi:hypothetical protein
VARSSNHELKVSTYSEGDLLPLCHSPKFEPKIAIICAVSVLALTKYLLGGLAGVHSLQAGNYRLCTLRPQSKTNRNVAGLI